MNHPARLLSQMLSTWHQDTTAPHLEALAAELTTEAVNTKGSLCVGLFKKDFQPRLFGLAYFLDSYGLIMRQRFRKQGDGFFVFIDLKPESKESEFKGNTVTEQKLEPLAEFVQAG